MNLPELFGDADTVSTFLDTPILLYYVFLVLFIIFLASGLLQMLSMKSRAVGFIFSLFPLAIGVWYLLLAYTEIFGLTSGFFAFVFLSEPFFDFYPIFIDLGTLGLGAYLLIAGGALGVISVFMEHD